ncbi:MAG: PqqD family protein [Sedimentisphaerales bacterium]|nr:PqqD family protein [Sedimentisphaerales bacterium]
MISETTLLRRADDVTYQSLGPEEDTVILSLRTGQLHTCNETTRALLDALDRPHRFDEIVDRLLQQYDVTREKLAEDMTSLAASLLREGIVVEAS